MQNDQQAARKAAVYEAALQLIGQGVSPAALKIQQLADAAGIGKGTVYEYFSSKEEILQGLAEYCFARENERVRAMFADCTTLAGLEERITGYLQELPETVDVSQTPDLLPALALLAAMRPQTTRFTGGAFLRRKESDRLHTVAAVLAALGVAVEELPDGLTVVGGRPLHGGVTLDAFDDHRIAMLCGCAALFCREPVVLRGGDCVAKSYEDFWRDYAMLGGKTEELMES